MMGAIMCPEALSRSFNLDHLGQGWIFLDIYVTSTCEFLDTYFLSSLNNVIRISPLIYLLNREIIEANREILRFLCGAEQLSSGLLKDQHQGYIRNSTVFKCLYNVMDGIG